MVRQADGQGVNFALFSEYTEKVGLCLGRWREILNSDAKLYGGGGYGNFGGVEAAPVPAHGRYHSLSVTSRAALQE